jgi:hypothetical protein
MIFKALFHLTPLLPVYFGFYYGFAACLLLVALPYIKSKKLEDSLAILGENSTEAQDQQASIQRSLTFWRRFTFLR